MPDFGSPFAGIANDRKLTHAELVRAIRFMVAAEYEAVQLYMQLAESIYAEQYTAWHLLNAPGTRGSSTLTRFDMIRFQPALLRVLQ
jgi:hypothetical protein